MSMWLTSKLRALLTAQCQCGRLRRHVIDAPQSGLKGLSQTLNKTIKMCYNAEVCDSTLVAKALGVSQE